MEKKLEVAVDIALLSLKAHLTRRRATQIKKP